MATLHLSTQRSRPISPVIHGSFRRKATCKEVAIKPREDNNTKRACKLNQVDHESNPSKPSIDVEGLISFLYDDLSHLFDDQGIDRTAYDEQVKYRDPLTKHDTINGYLFNISMVKMFFRPMYQLHWVKQTGPYEISTRWTLEMTVMFLPWKPEVVFTGTSVMGVNPNNGKFCSHVDSWDSIENNEYFSLEAFWDFIRQLWIYKTPNLETLGYQILMRTANYEVILQSKSEYRF